MTPFSINYQFNKLVKVTLSEKQALTEQQVTDNNIQMVDKSAKSPNFFQNNKPWERKYTTTTIKSRTFFCRILFMLVSVKRIFKMKVLLSTSICWLREILIRFQLIEN